MVMTKEMVLSGSLFSVCLCISVSVCAVKLDPTTRALQEADLMTSLPSQPLSANLLFVDSPAGVGFSYSNTTITTYGDESTSRDSYSFLLNWLNRFPQYKSNEFYISGESYAGHYVPQLAEVIFDENKRSAKGSYINLKGFAVGNPYMDFESDFNGMVDYVWGHALISDQSYKSIKGNCNFTKENQTIDCWLSFQAYYNLTSLIDLYSLYTPRRLLPRPFSAAPATSISACNLSNANNFL
ncbi:hypothetical protein MLD38_009889 [Melastoma candidum]|uniref:Uncharacterized protein n=1 Tax=Melastoma candidum TaxID=119954 RepID=A0ACB9S3B9_9MYRT|nr:hypothetical protein MLD38_009889 [Melastoma candidum]